MKKYGKTLRKAAAVVHSSPNSLEIPAGGSYGANGLTIPKGYALIGNAEKRYNELRRNAQRFFSAHRNVAR
jgi:hypothetical protein